MRGVSQLPLPSSPLGAPSVPWARSSALPWEGTKAVLGDRMRECVHPTQQGLGKSIIGLVVRKAIPKTAVGASSSSRGMSLFGGVHKHAACGAGVTHSPWLCWTGKGNRKGFGLNIE